MALAGRPVSLTSLDGPGTPPWEPPRLPVRAEVPDRADVVVAGAGITGLTAAWSLARLGCNVVVLERRFGSGATARSGGIILGETLVGPVAGFEGCERDLSQWIGAHRVACAFEWTGCLELARDVQLPPSPIDWQDGGAVRVAQVVDGGMLDPARLLTGLAEAACQAGVRIVDDAIVISVEASGAAIAFGTSRGDIVARTGLMAVDAWCRTEHVDLFPQRMMTFSLETSPLRAETLHELGLSHRRPFYTREHPLLWGRPTPAGTLIFGRELIEPELDRDRLARQAADAGARLARRVRALHPSLARVEIARVWGGLIGRNSSGVPSFERDPSIAALWWAGGYGGHGLAQAFRLGTRAARELGHEELRSLH